MEQVLMAVEQKLKIQASEIEWKDNQIKKLKEELDERDSIIAEQADIIAKLEQQNVTGRSC